MQSSIAARPVELLIRGGDVIDGSGAAARKADVAIADGRIVGVHRPDSVPTATEVIDAQGAVVAPGFIDIHGHSDLAVLSAPEAPSKILQGITTEVAGNCGLAVAPLADGIEIEPFRTALATGDVDPDVEWSWRSVAEYRQRIAATGCAMNIALLSGHLPLRVSCMGYAARPARPSEIREMQNLLDQALTEGSCGLSTGLSFPPMSAATVDELTGLGEVVAAHDRVFAFHMRNYRNQLTDSVHEALTVARQAKCRVQLSHLVAIGRDNWGAVRDALSLVDQALAEGIDVAVDIYPYIAGSGNLTQAVPDWALEGGRDEQMARLRDPTVRPRLIEGIAAGRAPDTWDEVTIAAGEIPDAPSVVGRSIQELALLWERPPAEVVAILLEQSNLTASMVAFGRCEADVETVLAHPATIIGSDGRALDPSGPSGRGQPHPRSYGCYPRLLGEYVRERGVLSLASAIHRSTGRPALRFGFRDRGLIAPGYVADLVVLDPAQIGDEATFERPHRFPRGIHTVVVGGDVVAREGATTGRLPGQFLPDSDLTSARNVSRT